MKAQGACVRTLGAIVDRCLLVGSCGVMNREGDVIFGTTRR